MASVCQICFIRVPRGRVLCRRLACKGEYRHRKGLEIWADPERRKLQSVIVKRNWELRTA
jgi:hypothetical protein